MQGGDSYDAVESGRRQRTRHNIINFEFDLQGRLRTRARYANHLRRKIYGGHFFNAARQGARESAGAAANLESALTVRRDLLQQKIVIVIVASPTFFVELREAVEISLDG